MFFFFMVVILNDRFEEAYSMMGDVGRVGGRGRELFLWEGLVFAWQLELFLGELRNVIVIKKTRQHHNCIDF